MTADREALMAILIEHLAGYRAMSHSELAKRLESRRKGDCLDVTDGVTADGTTYTIETNILWDDRSQRHIRVISDLTTGSRGCLFGLIPISVPNVTDDFIMDPSGNFIGE